MAFINCPRCGKRQIEEFENMCDVCFEAGKAFDEEWEEDKNEREDYEE